MRQITLYKTEGLTSLRAVGPKDVDFYFELNFLRLTVTGDPLNTIKYHSQALQGKIDYLFDLHFFALYLNNSNFYARNMKIGK